MQTTGLLRIGSDRSGVFISNEDAIVWAADMRKAMEFLKHNAPQTLRASLTELLCWLESVK